MMVRRTCSRDPGIDALVLGQQGDAGQHLILSTSVHHRHVVGPLVMDHTLDEMSPLGEQSNQPPVDVIDLLPYRAQVQSVAFHDAPSCPIRATDGSRRLAGRQVRLAD